MLEPTELAGLLGRPVNSVALASMTTVGSSSTQSGFRGVFVDGEALLMDDLTRHFLPDGVRVGPERARGVLRAMAAMHATFWEDPPIGDLGTAICPLERLLTRLSGTMLTSLSGLLPDIELVATFPEGWDLLAGVVDPGVARDLRALADGPAPIMTALDGCPITLLHGDLRSANVAWDGSRAIAIDWQPIVAPPAYDLVYFGHGSGGPLHPEEAMATYREMLAAELDTATSWSWWDDRLDICAAAVIAMMANAWALGEEGYDPPDPPWDSIHWWVARAERGLRLIGAA
jgi:hypothetical protein